MSTSPPRPSDLTNDDPAPTAAASARAAKGRRKLRRRASGTILLLVGLLSAGVITALLTPKAQVAVADPNTQSQAMIDAGKQLYATSCISCHGANLQGVADRGPSLIGVGDAAVYFQVASGRMPAARNEAQAARKPAKFTEAQITQLGKYVQSVSGGPQVYYERNADGTVKVDDKGIPVVAQESLRGKNLGRGSELFRLNCASCHNFTGRGGALSSGKFAPNLDPPNEQEIYTAMLTGPQNMPKFSNRQLSVEEKKDIIGFIKYSSESTQPGGLGLGGFGPVSEGMVMWVVGIGMVVGFAMWMGSRS
ncbi:menaquinol-cytochrome c reductase cytochrome c subunit [Gordonia araii NBRC 100433]|uniref:Cytochrome bc1 complex cytochrome c subunit n=1 Tax=Gordonia araii NBRC 100433 TaxID=1073574 RepID=G7H7L0_9ACTN|nr:cytochrome c [Gordonia araii]NNG97878.1 c-type cytochrome [Gordonia araii NBRC 100433]GAB11835.1 menaquinol-cytochrome c reductase cytochrome c subunit [Gordonia araii NBRC 100433]